MSSSPYSLQILEKADYKKQHIATYDNSLPQLGPSSIRVQSRVVGLTTNNITYARIGDALHWYDAHQLPFKDGEFSNAQKYGRTSAWGTGEVLESTVDFIRPGTKIWGYLPLSDLPVDKKVKQAPAPGAFIDTTEHRQQLWAIYNFYRIVPENQGNDDRYNGYAALTRILFETSYSLNRMPFGWDSSPPTNPLGLEVPPKLDTWTRQRANLRNATVIVMPASSKTAFTFAYMLRNARPKEEQPRAVVGLSSQASHAFCAKTKLYDVIADYNLTSAGSEDLASGVGLNSKGKVVLLDFGARPGIKDAWISALEAATDDFTFIRVGAAIPEEGAEGETLQARTKLFTDPAPNQYPSNADGQRNAGKKRYGKGEYLEDCGKEFNRFLEHESINALNLDWGKGVKGPNGIEGGWERLCSGRLGADEGLVFKLG